ncbi:MAG: OmpA family protein [Planctomycetes bacterium]|nr:OmpA family protein [Planctomycetota bacterium]
MTPRALLVLPALALALAGCDMRSGTRPAPAPAAPAGKPVAAAPASDDRVRALEDENKRLKFSLEAANRRASEGQGSGGTVADDVSAIAGGDIEGFERTAGGGVALPDDVAFAKGASSLTEAGDKAVARLATRLNEGANAGKAVLVVGHTDSSPVSRPATKEKYVDNWGLSAARAASVVRALEHHGIDAKRLQGGFRGQHQPRVAVTAEDKAEKGGKKAHDDKADDRRVEIYLK